MSQFQDPAFGAPPPKKKSSATMWIIIAILGVFVGLPLVCCGGCFLMGKAAINAGSAQIAKELENSPAIQEHLGANLTMSMNFIETANEQQKQGGNDKIIVFDASGSKGSGKIIGTTSQGGQQGQTLESATLRMPNGQEFKVK
jgi:hypothetical protein